MTEKKRSKTASQDSEGRLEDSEKNTTDRMQDSIEDSGKDTETMEILSPSKKPVVLAVSSQVSSPQPIISEKKLGEEREKMMRVKVAAELLQSGFSIRDTCEQTKLAKSTVEKISKRIRIENPETTDPKKTFNEKPFKYALERLEESEDDESAIDIAWFSKMQRKILKMQVETSMLRKAGLLGSDDNSGGGSKIDLNQILIAKVLSSNGNMNAKELTEFAASLKNLFAPQQTTTDPLEIFQKLQNIQSQGIQQYKEIESKALAQVQGQQNRSLIEKTIDGFVPVAKQLIASATQKVPPLPSIPMPQSLENLALPTEEPIAFARILEEGVESLPQTLPENAMGYTNLSKLAKK